jgi:disulfide bond formation protein DsbB
MSNYRMSRKLLGLLTALYAALIGLCAAAQAADFTLYNDVRTPIIGFYTQRPDGSWSPNWLSSPLPMGQHVGMTFANSAVNAACVRTYRIVTSGDFAGSVDRVHDFCRYLGLHMTATGPTHSEK